MASLVVAALSKYFQKYLIDFDRKRDFKSSLTGGKPVEFVNLQLNPDALKELMAESPLIIVAATVSKLTVHARITKILSEPVVIEVENVQVELMEPAELGINKDVKLKKDESDSTLEDTELDEQSKGVMEEDSTKQSYPLTEKIVDGIRVEIKSLHAIIRTQGPEKSKSDNVGPWTPPATHVLLRNLIFYTTDENWRIQPLDKIRQFNKDFKELFVFKRGSASLSVYATPTGVKSIDDSRAVPIFVNVPFDIRAIVRKHTGVLTSEGLGGLQSFELSVHIGDLTADLTPQQIGVISHMAAGLKCCLARSDLPKKPKVYGKTLDGPRTIINLKCNLITLRIREGTIAQLQRQPLIHDHLTEEKDVRREVDRKRREEEERVSFKLCIDDVHFAIIFPGQDFRTMMQGLVRSITMFEERLSAEDFPLPAFNSPFIAIVPAENVNEAMENKLKLQPTTIHPQVADSGGEYSVKNYALVLTMSDSSPETFRPPGNGFEYELEVRLGSLAGVIRPYTLDTLARISVQLIAHLYFLYHIPAPPDKIELAVLPPLPATPMLAKRFYIAVAIHEMALEVHGKIKPPGQLAGVGGVPVLRASNFDTSMQIHGFGAVDETQPLSKLSTSAHMGGLTLSALFLPHTVASDLPSEPPATEDEDKPILSFNDVTMVLDFVVADAFKSQLDKPASKMLANIKSVLLNYTEQAGERVAVLIPVMTAIFMDQATRVIPDVLTRAASKKLEGEELPVTTLLSWLKEIPMPPAPPMLGNIEAEIVDLKAILYVDQHHQVATDLQHISTVVNHQDYPVPAGEPKQMIVHLVSKIKALLVQVIDGEEVVEVLSRFGPSIMFILPPKISKMLPSMEVQTDQPIQFQLRPEQLAVFLKFHNQLKALMAGHVKPKAIANPSPIIKQSAEGEVCDISGEFSRGDAARAASSALGHYLHDVSTKLQSAQASLNSCAGKALKPYSVTDTITIEEQKDLLTILRMVSLRTRKHHLHTYKDCFVAEEAVTVLVVARRVDSRSAAVSALRKLEESNLIAHVGHHKGIEDDHHLYRFVNDERAEPVIVDMAGNLNAISSSLQQVNDVVGRASQLGVTALLTAESDILKVDDQLINSVETARNMLLDAKSEAEKERKALEKKLEDMAELLLVREHEISSLQDFIRVLQESVEQTQQQSRHGSSSSTKKH